MSVNASERRKAFVTLGMFIIDDFEFLDADGKPTGQSRTAQIGGGGTYAAVGARIWLSAKNIGMMVDRGHDFPAQMQAALDEYGGNEMFHFRDNSSRVTTRAVNRYTGDLRGFEYSTERVRITPRDTLNTPLERSEMLHFICSPQRAAAILSEATEIAGWNPRAIYEPIPDRCVPEELPALIKIIPKISILSPNADEALSVLSMPGPPTQESIEAAAVRLLEYGVRDAVIIRAGEIGAYVITVDKNSLWIPAYWSSKTDTEKVVDVTGAGNAFLGGLAAGLYYSNGDVVEAALYATVSASFTIEQEGLPRMTGAQFARVGQGQMWNEDVPSGRLRRLKERMGMV